MAYHNNTTSFGSGRAGAPRVPTKVPKNAVCLFARSKVNFPVMVHWYTYIQFRDKYNLQKKNSSYDDGVRISKQSICTHVIQADILKV